jgi:hypothetical protein
MLIAGSPFRARDGSEGPRVVSLIELRAGIHASAAAMSRAAGSMKCHRRYFEQKPADRGFAAAGFGRSRPVFQSPPAVFPRLLDPLRELALAPLVSPIAQKESKKPVKAGRNRSRMVPERALKQLETYCCSCGPQTSDGSSGGWGGGTSIKPTCGLRKIRRECLIVIKIDAYLQT